MRKIALLTVPLLMLGLVSLGADVMVDSPVTAAISGESTLTFGIDLGTNATGFKNEGKSDLKVTIVPKATADSGMMDTDDLYAYIELKDFEWVVTSADGSGKTKAPSVTTKLFMGPFSITTYSKPSLKVDYVDTVDGGDDNGDDKDDEYLGPDFADVEVARTGSGGVELQYKLDPVVFKLGVLSANDWEPDKAKDKKVDDCHTHKNDGSVVKCKDAVNDDGKVGNKDGNNEENAYAFRGGAVLDIGDSAKLDMGVVYAHEYDDKDIGIGAKATFDIGDIHPHVAFDGKIVEKGEIPWDVGAGLKWDLSADDKSSFATNVMMYSPGGADSKVHVGASLTEGDGDAGALEGLGAKLMVGFSDITADMSTFRAKVGASYLVEGIKPFFDVNFSDAKDAKTAFKAGLELTMIERMTTTLQYENKNITGKGDDSKGAVTTSIKIKY